MEADETLREYGDAVPVKMDGVAQSLHVLLENVNDLLSEQIGEAFTSFDGGLQAQQPLAVSSLAARF